MLFQNKKQTTAFRETGGFFVLFFRHELHEFARINLCQLV